MQITKLCITPFKNQQANVHCLLPCATANRAASIPNPTQNDFMIAFKLYPHSTLLLRDWLQYTSLYIVTISISCILGNCQNDLKLVSYYRHFISLVKWV